MKPEYSVETTVSGYKVSSTTVSDPFVFHRVTIGWKDLLKGLVRGKIEVVVTVSADLSTVEAVLELNDDYKGAPGSDRRRKWDAQLSKALESYGR